MKNKIAPTTILATQTAIAIILCYVISGYFQFDRSYWAVITTVFLISQTWGESLKKAFERIGMTILGGLTGTFIFLALQFHQEFLFPIMLLTVFFMVFYFGYSYKASAFYVTMFVVFLFAMLGQWDFHLLTVRIYETILGATIAVLTSIIVFPSHSKSNLDNLLKTFLVECKTIVDKSFSIVKNKGHKESIETTRDRLIRHLNKITETYKTSSYEMFFTILPKRKVRTLINEFSVLLHYITSLLECSAFIQEDFLSIKTRELLNEIKSILLFNLENSILLIDKNATGETIRPIIELANTLTNSSIADINSLDKMNPCAIHIVSFVYYLRKINEILLSLEAQLNYSVTRK